MDPLRFAPRMTVSGTATLQFLTTLQFAELAVIDNAFAFYAIGGANVVHGRLEQVCHEMRSDSLCMHRAEICRNPFRMRAEKLLHQFFAKAFVFMFTQEQRRTNERKRLEAHHCKAFFELPFQAIVKERRLGICAHGANTQEMLNALTFRQSRKRKRQTQIDFFLGSFATGLFERCSQTANHGIATAKVRTNARRPLRPLAKRPIAPNQGPSAPGNRHSRFRPTELAVARHSYRQARSSQGELLSLDAFVYFLVHNHPAYFITANRERRNNARLIHNDSNTRQIVHPAERRNMRLKINRPIRDKRN